MIIAIQPDNYGPNDASAPLWTTLLEQAGHTVKKVNVYHADILDQLDGCDAFMWRHIHSPEMRQIAKRLLPVIERELSLMVYPDQNTCWHYDDKIAQAHLLSSVKIPIPKTWVWFEKQAAHEWARNAGYPLVLKLWAGAGSTNVMLVRNYKEASAWINRLFKSGIMSFADSAHPVKERVIDAVRILLRGDLYRSWELHKNYALFQEFLPSNDYDTRITVIGNRAFGFRRFNRKNDFRASGSGNIDYNPQHIAKEILRLAFQTTRKLKMQSCAIDALWRAGKPVIAEVSYTYASWAIYNCPGHWDSDLNWHEGHMWPEEAQVMDFSERLKNRESEAKLRLKT